MMIALCIACQYGDHSGHVERVSPSEGMLGGTECPCRGGCKPTQRVQADIARTAAALDAARQPKGEQ